MEQVAALLEHLKERLGLLDAIFVDLCILLVVFVGVVLIILIIHWRDGALHGVVHKVI